MRKYFGASLALSVICLLALGWVYAGNSGSRVERFRKRF